MIAFLKLIAENHVPEIMATIDLYHQWLDARKPSVGAIVDEEGQEQCHQFLGELEHVQVGVPIKRIALLDDVSHHYAHGGERRSRWLGDEELLGPEFIFLLEVEGGVTTGQVVELLCPRCGDDHHRAARQESALHVD